MSQPTMSQRIAAEVFGTFWLTFGGCGSAVLAAVFMTADGSKINLGIGLLGVSLAFGLTVLTAAYAVGHVSGGHFNPAVTTGLACAKRFDWKDVPAYWIAQIIGASVAAAALYGIASGAAEGVSFTGKTAGEFATNGFGELSPGGYSLTACLIIEILLTAVFLWVILGVTDKRAPVGFAPIAIGLALTLIHLISIPVTNTSVNPARSIGPALFAGGDHITQLWLFIAAPLVGAIIAGFTYKGLFGEGASEQLQEASQD